MRFASTLSLLGAAALLGACSTTPDAGDIIVVKGEEMVYIPGGTFTMGDSAIGGTVRVTLKPYLIDRCEVTNGEFREFARRFRLPFPVPRAYDNLPVVNVDWETIDAFAAWRSCRLPTEAEWEYAARGPRGYTFPWGNGWDPKLANGNDNTDMASTPDGSVDGFARLAPVGLFPKGASPFGALDMAGNVWEWVADWLSPYPASDTAIVEYAGPTTGERKVIRGGSYRTSYVNLRSFHRAYQPPSAYRDDVGFRCASDYPVPKSLVESYLPDSLKTH